MSHRRWRLEEGCSDIHIYDEEEKGGNTVGAFLYASLHSRQQMPFL